MKHVKVMKDSKLEEVLGGSTQQVQNQIHMMGPDGLSGSGRGYGYGSEGYRHFPGFGR